MVRSPSTDPEQIYRAIREAIAGNLADPELGTASIAAELGVSARRLQRVASLVGDTTVRDLVHEARLQRAFELMIRDGLPARTVAPMVGYRGGPYLAKRFRGRFGAPPHVLRARYAALGQRR